MTKQKQNCLIYEVLSVNHMIVEKKLVLIFQNLNKSPTNQVIYTQFVILLINVHFVHCSLTTNLNYHLTYQYICRTKTMWLGSYTTIFWVFTPIQYMIHIFQQQKSAFFSLQFWSTSSKQLDLFERIHTYTITCRYDNLKMFIYLFLCVCVCASFVATEEEEQK